MSPAASADCRRARLVHGGRGVCAGDERRAVIGATRDDLLGGRAVVKAATRVVTAEECGGIVHSRVSG